MTCLLNCTVKVHTFENFSQKRFLVWSLFLLPIWLLCCDVIKIVSLHCFSIYLCHFNDNKATMFLWKQIFFFFLRLKVPSDSGSQHSIDLPKLWPKCDFKESIDFACGIQRANAPDFDAIAQILTWGRVSINLRFPTWSNQFSTTVRKFYRIYTSKMAFQVLPEQVLGSGKSIPQQCVTRSWTAIIQNLLAVRKRTQTLPSLTQQSHFASFTCEVWDKMTSTSFCFVFFWARWPLNLTGATSRDNSVRKGPKKKFLVVRRQNECRFSGISSWIGHLCN